MKWYVLGILLCLVCIGVSAWGLLTFDWSEPSTEVLSPNVAVSTVSVSTSVPPEPIKVSDEAATETPAAGGGAVRCTFTVVSSPVIDLAPRAGFEPTT